MGSAVVSNHQTLMFTLLPHSSSYTAELYALLQGLFFIQENNLVHCLIITDSLSSLQAIVSPNPSPLALLLIDTLDDLSHHDIHFLWVPSHMGVADGNDRADAAAQKATMLPHVPAPISTSNDVRTLLTNSVSCQWQTSWTAVTGNKLRSIKPTLGPWASSNRPSRREEVVLARMRLGHTRATHGFLLAHEDPPSCPSCSPPTPLSVAHILVDCPGLAHLRPPSPTPHTLLSLTGDKSDVNATLNFLKATPLWSQY